MRTGRFRARFRQQRGLHAVLPAPHKIEELPIAKGNIPRTPGVREKHMRRSNVPKLRNMVDQFIRTISSDIVPVSVRTGAPIRTWRPPPPDGDVFGRGDVLEAVGATIPRQPPEGRPGRFIVDAERNMARPVRAARSTASLCPEPPRRRPRTLRLMAEKEMASPRNDSCGWHRAARESG